MNPVRFVLFQAFSPEIASLEMRDVLHCRDRDVQNHLKTFYDNLDTSPVHLTDTSGEHHGVWGGYGVWMPPSVSDHCCYCARLVSQGVLIATGAVWQSMLVYRKLTCPYMP